MTFGRLKLFSINLSFLSYFIVGSFVLANSQDFPWDEEKEAYHVATAVTAVGYETNNPVDEGVQFLSPRRSLEHSGITRVDGIDYTLPCGTEFGVGARYVVEGGLFCSAHWSTSGTRQAAQIQLLSNGRIKHALQIQATSNVTGQFLVYDQNEDFSLNDPIIYDEWPFLIENQPLPLWGFDSFYWWESIDSPNNITVELTNSGDFYTVTVDGNDAEAFNVTKLDSEAHIDQIKVLCFVEARSNLFIANLTGIDSECPWRPSEWPPTNWPPTNWPPTAGPTGLPTTTTEVIEGGGPGTTAEDQYWGLISLLSGGIFLLLWLLVMGVIYAMKSYDEASAVDDNIQDVSFVSEPMMLGPLTEGLAVQQADGAGLVELDPDNSFWVA